jgi:hypothetical protein
MLRVIVRFIGLMLMAAGFAALVIDGTRSIASNALVLTSLREMLSRIAPSKFPLIEAATEKKLGHWAWDPLLTTIMSLPTWLVVGGIGALLFLATRRRRIPIGYVTR